MLSDTEAEIVNNALKHFATLEQAYSKAKEEVVVLSDNYTSLHKKASISPNDEGIREQLIRAEVALQNTRYKKEVLGQALIEQKRGHG